MNTRSYDTFKAVVAVLLLIILLWRVFTVPPTLPEASLPPTAEEQESNQQASPTTPPVVTPPLAASTATQQPVPTATELAVSSATVTETVQPTLVPTIEVTQTAEAAATETTQPTTQETATGLPASECPLALPSRLAVGDTARVTSRLHMREGAGLTNPIILTNSTGTLLEITGGPVCESYQGGAYLWWQVSRPDGQTGWSAEGSAGSNFYFLEPVD